jgi:Heterokaryon incompatibility protein (HET)
MNPKFSYKPLNTNSNQIRVLSVQAQPGDADVIRCNLKTVDLEDCTLLYKTACSASDLRGWRSEKGRMGVWHAISSYLRRPGSQYPSTELDVEGILKENVPNRNADYDVEGLEDRFRWGDYIALSYVWGDPTQRRDILVNDRPFSVTKNLHLALCRLRDSSEVQKRKVKIWVDAICINQNDPVERASEVQKMGLIFSKALSVRAWLGPASDEVSSHFPSARSFLSTVFESRELLDVSSKLIGEVAQAHSLWVVSRSVFFEPYWERLWIMQEISLASSLLFWYGEHFLTTEEIFKLYQLFGNGGLAQKLGAFFGKNAAVQFIGKSGRIFARLIRLRPWMSSSVENQLALSELIHLAQSSQATDLRDKVYGILALLPKSISSHIQPNYKTDSLVADAYTNFSKTCFLKEGNLNTLARIKIYPSRRSDIPSWAFDLDTISEDTLSLTRHKFFNANLGLESIMAFSKDGQLLTCEGAFVTKLDSLAATWRHEMRKLRFSPIQGGEIMEPTPPTSVDAIKLALARALNHDSSFTFSDGPSLLDIPWISSDELGEFDPEYTTEQVLNIQDFHMTDIGRCWPVFTRATPLAMTFLTELHPNENFELHGIPLRNFFTSEEEYCANPKGYFDMSMNGVFADRRLCTTANGLIGSVPKYAIPGDKVAVLSASDMPVLLRPRGDHYEFLGSCFFDGLMNGEAAAEIQKGHLKMEAITLC